MANHKGLALALAGILWASVISLVSPLFAQGSPVDVDSIHSGSMLVAFIDTPLRNAPPSGLFYALGAQIGTISSGESLSVIAVKVLNTPLRQQQWVRVQRRSTPQGQSSDGWVYTGDLGAKSCCFR